MAFVIGLLAPVVVSLWDAFVGLSLPGSSVSGLGEQGPYFFAVLGPSVITGSLLAAALLVIVVLNGWGAIRVRSWEVGYGTVAGALGLIGFLEWANLTLFEGGSISAAWYRPIVEWVMRLAIPVGVACAVRFGAPMITASVAGEAKRSHRVVGLVCLFGSAALCFTNARLYSNLYDYIHFQEVVLAILAAAIGLFLLSAGSTLDAARTGRRSIAVAALVAGVFMGAIVTRDADGYRRARSAALSRAKALPYHASWGQDLLDKIRPPRELQTIDVSDLVAKLRGATSAELRARLDDILPDRRRFNLLWLSVDTLRGDRCGFNGHGGGLTPRLDKLAAESFVFTQAHTAYPTSNYSYSSILTSLYPRTTPAYKYVRNRDHEFAPTVTLSGLLSKNGWYSVGVTAFNQKTMSDLKWFGSFREGFDAFNPDQTEKSGTAPETNASTLRVIRERPSRPYFVWAHYLEPHAPYLNQPGFDLGDSQQELYDSEVAYSDGQIGELLDKLKVEGHLDNTIIVFFSDHGEAFGEHGVQFHNSSVYESQIHVPLCIRIPGISGRRIDKVVNLVDVLPTIVDLVGVEDDERRFGRSLLPMMFGAEEKATGFSYSEVFGWMSGQHARDQRALIHGRHKIITRPYQQTYEIYDLAADPGEQNSLVGKDEALEQRLYSMIQSVDREIDGYFGDVLSAEEARAQYIAKVDREVDVVCKGDAATRRAEFRNLYKSIMTPYGDMVPDAERWLGREGVEGYLDRLAAAYPDIPTPTNYLLIRYIGLWRSPRYIPFLKTELARSKGAGRALIAQGLALAGDDSGREDLRKRGDQPSGIGLAYLGDPAGLRWLQANLQEGARTIVCHALRCIGKYPEFDGARFVRGRFTLSGISYEMRRALLEGLEHSPDPDATVLLVRMAQAAELDVREGAIKLLRERMSDDDLAKNLKAMAAEMGAEIAAKNSVFLLAVAQYRRSLEMGTLYNSHARLRLARAQVMAGRNDGARKTLEEVAANSDVVADRALAQRRLEQRGSPFRLDADKVKVEVDPSRVELNTRIARGLPVMVDVPVRNASEQHWSGGRWRLGISLHLGFEDADGNLVESRGLPNYLPEEGISAGEEKILSLVGVAPRQSVKGCRLVLILKQEWLNLKDNGVVYRHPTPIDL